MAERATIDVLDEGGRLRGRFIDTESARESRRVAVAHAWRRGVIAGAAGASTAFALVKWLSEEE